MDMSNFVCCICRNIPDSVAESGCCHSIFCWSCVLQNGKAPCPSCNKTLEPEMCNENVAIQKLIDKIPKACKNIGCSVMVPASAMQAHCEQCEYGNVLCPNSELCGLLSRKDLAGHERESCAFRTVRCHSCEDPFPLNELPVHLEQDCPNVVVECVNNCLAKGIVRVELTRHLAFDCTYAPVTCPFASYGCEQLLLRGQVEAHLKDDVGRHLLMMKSLVEAQQKEISELREQVQNASNAPRIILQQTQEFLCENLQPFRPALERVSSDIRARLRWSSLVWFILILFGLKSVYCFVKILAIVYLCVQGYKRYVLPFRRPLWARYRREWHLKMLSGVYVAMSLLFFLLILKLC